MLTVLSPHYDDAAFSLALTLGALLRTGTRVQLVNVHTRSRYAPLAPDVSGQDAVSALRAQEDRTFRALHGEGLTVVDLDRGDALERPGYVDEQDYLHEGPLTPTEEAEVARLTDALKDIEPGAALLLPMAFGGHIDHRITRAAAEARWPSLPRAYFEDLPYSLAGHDERAFRSALGQLDVTPHVFEVPTADLHSKYQAVMTYRSQITPSVALKLLERAQAYGTGERLWADAPFLAWLRTVRT